MNETRRTRKVRFRLKTVNYALLFFVGLLLFLAFWFSSGPDTIEEGSVLNFTKEEAADIFINFSDKDGSDVRVLIMVIGTKVDEALCGHIASAAFSGIPVVVVGFNERYHHMKKLRFYRRAARQAGLKPNDVVLMMDSDIFYTGIDVIPLIQKYIMRSPANLQALDAKSVREGSSDAPIMISVENPCYAVFTFIGDGDLCKGNYARLSVDMLTYQTLHNMSVNPRRKSWFNEIRHLNSGFIIARVWALDYFQHAIELFTEENPPRGNGVWNCDQSVYAALYFDLIYWEIQNNILFTPTALKKPSSHYGLFGGMISVDDLSEFAAPPHNALEFSTVAWNHTTNLFPLKGYIDEDFDIAAETTQFNAAITNLYDTFVQQGGAFKDKRKVAKSKETIPLAPPLYSVIPRSLVDIAEDGSLRRVYPAMIHFAGWKKKSYTWRRTLWLTMWSIPMRFNLKAKENGISILRTMPVELWGSSRKTVTFGDVCDATALLS